MTFIFKFQLFLRKHFQAIDGDLSLDETEKARRKQVRKLHAVLITCMCMCIEWKKPHLLLVF